jgi:hypothetical protein
MKLVSSTNRTNIRCFFDGKEDVQEEGLASSGS